MNVGNGKENVFSFMVLLLFLLFFVIGVNVEEVAVVWEKATRICLSCMGIG